MAESTISGVEPIHVRFPLAEPIASALGTYTHVDGVVVLVRTAGGIDGTGFTFCLGGAGGFAVAPYIERELGPQVVGLDAADPGVVWDTMWRSNKARVAGGLGAWGLSAIDIACWDIATKARGAAMHEVAGGVAPPGRVPVYGSGGWHTLSDAQLVAECASFAELGIDAYKFKIGTERDLERVSLLRREMGADIVLLADANQRYEPAEAVEVSAMLADHGVAWLEEPVVANSFSQLAIVAAEGRTPVAAGENVYFRWGFEHLVESGAAYLQPDVCRCGGVSEFLKIAGIAEAADVSLSSHLWHELSISLVGPAAAGGRVEYAPLVPPDVLDADFSVEGGAISVPSGPGHGVRFTSEALRRFAV